MPIYAYSSSQSVPKTRRTPGISGAGSTHAFDAVIKLFVVLDKRAVRTVSWTLLVYVSVFCCCEISLPFMTGPGTSD